MIISDFTKVGFTAKKSNGLGIMPRFYFHLKGDLLTIDKEGIALPNVTAARRLAREAAADLIADQIRTGGYLNPRHRIDVTDKYGNEVFSLVFRELIEDVQ